MGESVYRYRKISDYSIAELMDDEIVGSTADLMNDPYDCRFYYNVKIFNEFLDTNNIKMEIQDTYCNGNCTADFFINCIIDKIKDIILKSFYIVCLSKYNNKEIMWSHYADNGKGFVLEYDKDTIISKMEDFRKTFDYIKDDDFFELCDVKYCEKRTDHTNLLINVFKIMMEENNFFQNIYNLTRNKYMTEIFKKIVTEKNIDWKYENESRIICSNHLNINSKDLNSGHKKIIELPPKAIYVGENCPRKDRLLLYYIAQNKRIRVYNMESINNENYKLDAIEIPKKELDKSINKLADDYDEYQISYKYLMKKLELDD